jgi:hypothetical protein
VKVVEGGDGFVSFLGVNQKKKKRERWFWDVKREERGGVSGVDLSRCC